MSANANRGGRPEDPGHASLHQHEDQFIMFIYIFERATEPLWEKREKEGVREPSILGFTYQMAVIARASWFHMDG